MRASLEEITAYLARVRSDLGSVVERTPAAAFDHKPSSGGWSGAGIIQHLGKVEGSSTKLLERLFATAIEAGMGMEQVSRSWLGSLDHLGFTDRGRRIVAPERVAPEPNPDFSASWASLQAVRQRLLRAVTSVDGRDLTVISAPHPVLGPLNGYQWVLFIGQHEERHLSQLRETLSTA